MKKIYESYVGLVPAAGEGTRFKHNHAKEIHLVEVDGKRQPICAFTLENLAAAGIGHTVVITNHRKSEVMRYLGSGAAFGGNISYVVQDQHTKQGSSPGLAQALDSAYHLTRGKGVVFGMPDTIVQPRNVFAQMLPYLKDSDLVLGLMKKPQTSYALIDFVDDDINKGQVAKINDKDFNSSRMYSWGCIAWRPVFTEFLHKQVLYDNVSFADIMNKAIEEEFICKGIVCIEKYIDIGTGE